MYSLVAQEERSCTLTHVVDNPILTNSYDAKKGYGRYRGINYGGNGKNNSRHFTHWHKYGHTADFCYKKYDHPHINKTLSSVNTYNNTNIESQQPNFTSDSNQQESNIFGLTQEKYDQLVCLLQQANSFPSVS